MMRNVYVELDYNDGAPQTRTFSIYPDETGEGRLMSPLKFSIKVRTWIQNESTTSGLSKIIICNADGELDSFADETFTAARIKQNVNGTVTTLAYGLISRVILSGVNFMEISLKDATKILDIPMQNEFFPASETSDTGSGTNTYYALEGQPRPLSFGRPKSIKPVLVNRSNNEYHFHDEQAEAINIAYDNGVSVSEIFHTKGFTLGVDPAGIIVADIRGAQTIGASNDARKIHQIWEYIFDKHSITDYSLTDLEDIDTDKSYRYSYYQDNTSSVKIKEILRWFCDSFTGWFYADESGYIRFGYLDSPAVSEDLSISELDIFDSVKVFDDLAPNITTKAGSDRNFYVYNSDDIAAGATAQNKINLAQKWRSVQESSNTLDDFYQSVTEPHDTLIQLGSNALSEIDHVIDLYSQRRKFYTFDTSISAEIGETVKLTYPRFGLDSGVNLLCVGREIDFINNTYRLTLWG